MNKILKGQIVMKFGSQFIFSKEVGEHEGTISEVIRGKRNLSPDKQKIWAKALGVEDPNKLFGGNGHDRKTNPSPKD